MYHAAATLIVDASLCVAKVRIRGVRRLVQ